MPQKRDGIGYIAIQGDAFYLRQYFLWCEIVKRFMKVKVSIGQAERADGETLGVIDAPKGDTPRMVNVARGHLIPHRALSSAFTRRATSPRHVVAFDKK